MGFFSFFGRLLLASFFILSAWQMFNELSADGGHAAKELRPKLVVVSKHLSDLLGKKIPDVDVKQVVTGITFMKGIGGFLFILGSSFGAYLLLLQLAFTTPILYDFYNYDPSRPKFEILLNEFAQNMALFGALLFFIGMKGALPKRQVKKKAPKSKTV
ncbi:uncharacterized protein LOC116194984 [Punica granatum]|uniref:Uncharacterized protein LOC116194984 n=2 Tax=Punica granatum TaxID=22663 RepID=A0A6P8CE81_PUNGR|nr:uncharacterized protein LOC116194984 [Punica granatum]PKI36756.1 hypothetical protein CRG98_042858 [Punica granatum]